MDIHFTAEEHYRRGCELLAQGRRGEAFEYFPIPKFDPNCPIERHVEAVLGFENLGTLTEVFVKSTKDRNISHLLSHCSHHKLAEGSERLEVLSEPDIPRVVRKSFLIQADQ